VDEKTKQDKAVELIQKAIQPSLDKINERIEKIEGLPTKNAEILKGSDIEVGKPDMYKGFNFKIQGKDQPDLLPKDEKERDQVVKEVIDVFAPYSKNPSIRKAAMQEGTSGEGAEYVPEQWFSTVIEKARLVSIALQDCRRFPIVGTTLHIPKQGTSVSLTYAAEEAASSESEPGSDDMDLTAKRYGLWGKFSEELLDDAMIDIVSYITRDAVEAAGQKIDDLVFNGDAYAFTGVLGAGSTDVTFGSSNTATSYTDMVSRNFFDAVNAVPDVRLAGAKWYLSRKLMPFIMDLKYGASDSPLLNYDANSIIGYPFSKVEKISGTDATSTDFITFGSMQWYALGVRSMSQGIEVAAPAGTEFKQHQRLFRYFLRMAGAPIFTDHFINLKTA